MNDETPYTYQRVLCYCNSHRHTVAEHPVAGCLVPGCECARLEEPDAT